MIEDLSFHIVDVVQNSVTAGADRVEIVIEASVRKDRIQLKLSLIHI